METPFHPLVFVYRQSMAQRFPLILVVGREPNHVKPMGTEPGPYDFAHAPACKFWNHAYCATARAVGTSVREFKFECARRDASPIMFTDISPISIPTHVSRKQKRIIRRAVPHVELASLVSRILDLSPLVARVRVCLLAIDEPIFAPAKRMLETALGHRGVHVTRCPFFDQSTSNECVDAAIGPHGQSVLADVVAAFRTPG